MATIIEVGNGSFIAGDPEVPVGIRPCWCGGSGLEYDYDGFLAICHGCFGLGHRGERAHPLVPVRPEEAGR